MGKRHNTLSDEIFKNSIYINALEEALGIEDFKKECKKNAEYKGQYEMMLDVFKTLININNILFSDSNKNIKEKQDEINDILFKIIYKDSESTRLKYSIRTQKALKDSYTRYLYNKFIDWYNNFYTFSFDTLKQEVENEMTRLENVNFDKMAKDGLQYEKNKNSNYKIITSKLDYLYPNCVKEWKKYQKDFYDTYGKTLNQEEKKDIYFIYKLIAYANNGIVRLLFNDIKQDFVVGVKDNADKFFKFYLKSLNIDIKDNDLFIENSQIFYEELCILNKKILEYEEENPNKSIIKNFDIQTVGVVSHYDLFFFYINMYNIINGTIEIKAKTDFLVKIVNDLKEIYNLIYENVPNITNINQVQEAFDKIQKIVERNKEMFERLS